MNRVSRSGLCRAVLAAVAVLATALPADAFGRRARCRPSVCYPPPACAPCLPCVPHWPAQPQEELRYIDGVLVSGKIPDPPPLEK